MAVTEKQLWQESGPAEFAGLLRPRRQPAEANLDITPMIDITFLLLIYFLVAAVPDHNSSLDLPDARYGVGVARTESIIVTIGEGGLAGAPVFLADGKDPNQLISGDFKDQSARIERYVRRQHAAGLPNVLIKADKGVAYRDVARVAAAASRVEGIRLHFAVIEID